jgi:hypothetical protein
MSSIMDELRRLQGRRTPGRPLAPPDPSSMPDASEPLDGQLVDAPRAPIGAGGASAAQPARSPRALLGGLIAILVVATVLSVIALAGRSRERSAPATLASRQEMSQETTAPADVAAPAPDIVEPTEPNLEADTTPAEIDLVLARLHVVEAIEPLAEPRFELVEPPAGQAHDGAEAAPDPEAAEPDAPEPAKEPVRVLTTAEDKANKAAIRSLKVFGVIADERGVGVYTSEGELRKGERFNGMAIIEVTSRYVLFECGNKRYRWMLPRRHAHADREAS